MKKESFESHGGHVHAKPASVTDVGAVLRAGGFRVTAGRVALLTLLETAGIPLSIQSILETWSGNKPPDTATLYRSLTDLHAAGIVRRIELGTGTVHYEYTPNRPHHHHLICNNCGVVEELEHCSLGNVETQVLSSSRVFKSIYSHNLEFFGECAKCATKK
jgi:Fur family ferric uptake transcriptional regulator